MTNENGTTTRLSKESSFLLNCMLNERRKSKLKAVNINAFLTAIFHPDNPKPNILENYVFNNTTYTQDDLDDIEAFIALEVKSSNQDSSQTNEISTTFHFFDNDGQILELPVDQEVSGILEPLFSLVEKYQPTEITPEYFIISLFLSNNSTFQYFVEELFDIDFWSLKGDFKQSSVLSNSLIPFELQGFLYVLNDKIDGTKPCQILKRDVEAETMWNIMLKSNKRNIVIVGEAGVGKTAIMEKITYDIVSDNCPEQFKDFKVVSLDVNSLIAGTSYRGDAEQRISDLIDFLKDNQQVILFIDEVHTILGAGSCYEGEMDLANALKPILARGETIVVGATTTEEYEKYFSKDAALSRRFEKLEVKEPLASDVYSMIENKIKALSDFHHVNITRKMVNYAIMIASCFAFQKKNPDKTLDLLDRAMVAAKRSHLSYVTKDCILKNFSIYFDKWKKMSLESKLQTAYHEAGHYIFLRASECLTEFTPLAVSIMPAEDYLGVTVYEINDNVSFQNLDYFVDLIAFNLAGRVGENFHTNDFTQGASNDLENATQTAFHVVTKLGMVDSFKKHIYLNNSLLYSEKSVNMIDEEVEKLIEKGYSRANDVLEKYCDVLDAIAHALVKNNIMSDYELQRLWKSVM